MPFSPVIPSSVLPEHEVIRPENLPERTGPQAVHGPRLEVQEHGSRHVPPTTRLVVVHIDPLELNMGVPDIVPNTIDSMFVTDNLPELASDLVPALAGLDMEDFSHFQWRKLGSEGVKGVKMGFCREGR